MGMVCQICGDLGVVAALVCCDSCTNGYIHRYCLDITPVPIEDYIIWFCADCEGSDISSESKGEEILYSAKAHELVTNGVDVSEKSEKRKEEEKEKQEH